uniref:Uncharacterized protein n=1 Tax=Rhipicephalus appendiculatus TaxID=34631 RepID=A0A131YYQ4_RHIAP
MSSDVSLGSGGESWPPTKSAQRQLTISWIQVITGIVQLYCVMFHCVFLMLIAVWMAIKEVSRRVSVLWVSWYSDFKEKRPAALPLLLEAIHMNIVSKITPQTKPSADPEVTEDAHDTRETEDVSDENDCSSYNQSEVVDVAETKVEECCSSAPTVSASTSGVCSSSSPPASRVADETESESSTSLDTPLHNQPDQQPSKRAPCSISAVVEDKYACGLNRSTSSSAVSIEDLDDSSDDDGVDGFDERCKSTNKRPDSANVSCTGSWKLKSAFQRASGKSSEIQSCFAKPKTPIAQAPCPEKSKFSLGPVISNLRRVCSRTLSAINKELTECMSPQSQKSRGKKTETPARDTSQVASSREVHRQPQQAASGDASKDLSVPEHRTSLQSSWNDVCSSGTPTSSDSLGEMHRGLLDSFSEADSSDFPNRQSADHPFGGTAPEKEPTPFSGEAASADGNFAKGNPDWTTQNAQSNAFFNDHGTEANAFGTAFQTDCNSTGWEF